MQKAPVTDVAGTPPPSNIARRRLSAREGNGGAYRGRRGEILKAAAEIFRARSVARTTLEDIAQQVGLDRASLYYYFSSKEQLVEELLGFAVESNVRQAEAIAASDSDPTEKLRQAVNGLMTSYAEHYPYLYIFVDEYLGGAHQQDESQWMRHAVSLARRYDDAIQQIVAEGMAVGAFRDVASEAIVARGIVGMMNSTSRWFRPKRTSDADDVAAAFVNMILNGIVAT